MEAGHLEDAIDAFLAAGAAGLDTGALHFNLGVAHYRLDRVEEAREAFLRASRFTSMAGPAKYNLGRIARENGRRDEAIRWFRAAARSARTAQVRSAALNALESLAPGAAVSGTRPGVISLGAGYDSNVPLLPDESAAAGGTSDAFLFGRLEVEQQLSRDSHLFADLYAEQFDDGDRFDLEVIEVGYGHRFDGDDWARDAELAAEYLRFGGKTFSRGVSLGADASRVDADGNWLLLDGSVSAVRGGDDFDYLDGTTASVGATLGGATGGSGYLYTGIRLHRESRRDLDRGADFYSYSRTGAALQVGYGRALTASFDWSAGATFAWRYYDDPERRGGRALGTRDDRITRLSTGLEARLGRRWALTADVALERRRSSIDAYDYDRETVRLGLRRRF